MSRSLSVVLKTAERCNVNCRYCYFFFGGDESFKVHPPLISRTTLIQVAKFLRHSSIDLSLDQLHVVFHGGEPMLQGRTAFEQMCELFRNEVAPAVTHFDLCIQTNGTLIDEGWADVFSKHAVRVGISIDGPREIHDRNRLDHRGRGTYDRAVRGLRLLQDAHRVGLLAYSPALLCVIDPTASGQQLFRHFVRDLQVREIDFLLPDSNPDSRTLPKSLSFSKFICEVFDAWREHRSDHVDVKFISALLHRFAGESSFLFDHVALGDSDQSFREAITIASDGSLWPDDSMRSTALWQHGELGSVFTTAPRALFDNPTLLKLQASRRQIPKPCGGCTWENLCGGGFLQNRWSAQREYDNASVYCEGLQEIFMHVAAHLARKGASARFFEHALGWNNRARAERDVTTA